MDVTEESEGDASSFFFRVFDFVQQRRSMYLHPHSHHHMGSRSLLMPMLLVASTAILMVACNATIKLLRYYCLQPWALARALHAQGLKGPAPRFLLGNMSQIIEMRNEKELHDMKTGDHYLLSRICPYYCQWSEEYGKTFVFWCGTEPRIPKTDSESLKQILCTKSEYFGKSSMQLKGGILLLGNGLIFANGSDWAKRRQIVGPAFHVDKLKEMVALMVNCTSSMLQNWDKVLMRTTQGSLEMDVYDQFAGLTSDIIVRTAFGSGFHHGKKVFQILKSLENIFSEYNRYIWVPGYRLLPTHLNRKASKLQQEMKSSLQAIIESRRASDTCDRGRSPKPTDLLGLLMAESNKNEHAADEEKFGAMELVEECRTFFFVGHETTSLLLTWTIMLLSLHPYWQEQARAEVVQVCKGSEPHADLLNRLKIVGMILNESLRLYPPAPTILRTALDDVEIGSMYVPKGTTFWIPILAIHHDPAIWGTDASEFKPERFSDGNTNSCKQSLSFLPFSFGSRSCVGQTFALMEAKVVLVMLLQNYRFCLSPKYRHAPTSMITLKPKYGMPAVIEKL